VITLSRRRFFGTLAAIPWLPAVLHLERSVQVVSIHHDLPYVDSSGTSKPYIPPSRRGAVVSESTLRSRHGFV
jgi:hypothetical protein